MVDDSWTGSERQVTLYYVINGSKNNKTAYICTYNFTHCYWRCSVCRSKPLSPRTFLFSILSNQYWTISGYSVVGLQDVLTNISVFPFGTNPWFQPQPQPGDEAHSWGWPWACPPEPLLWRAWCKLDALSYYCIYRFNYQGSLCINSYRRYCGQQKFLSCISYFGQLGAVVTIINIGPFYDIIKIILLLNQSCM